MFNLTCALLDHVIRVVELSYELCPTIHQLPARFGGYMPSGRRYFSFLVCHMTSCDQVLRETSDLLGAFTSP